MINHGEPIIAPDITAERGYRASCQLQLGLRSCAVLPIGSRGAVRGILHIASRVFGRFDEEQKNHLMAIARQLSIAMENRKLFEEVRASRDELAQANAALSESNRKLSALHAVAAAASQSTNLKGVMDRAIEKITEIFGFAIVRIHLYDEKTRQITRRATCDKDPELLTDSISFKTGQGIVGTVVQTGQALIFENIGTDTRYRQLSRNQFETKFNYQFLGVFPIRSKSRMFGRVDLRGRRAAPA